MRLASFSLVFFGLFLCALQNTHAQTAPTIVLNPAFPQPNEVYTASVEDGARDIATIKWFVDGSPLEGGRGGTNVSLAAKGLGVRQKIVADVTYTDGLLTRIEKLVTPLRIDLIVSPQTQVPSFYKGRSELSGESSAVVTALVFSGSPKGETYRYLWNVGGKNQNGGLPTTQNFVSFESGFKNEIPVVVSLYSGETLVGEASVIVPVVKNEVHFYERNPLRGLSKIALISPHFFIGEEMIIRAEQFFTRKQTAATPTWYVDGVNVTENANANEITLEKRGEGSKTRVQFEERDLGALLQSIRGSLDIQF